MLISTELILILAERWNKEMGIIMQLKDLDNAYRMYNKGMI